MIQGLKYKRLIIIITHLHAYFIVSSLMNRPVQLRRNVLAWENARGLVKRRGTGRGEWRMKSIGNVEKLPSSISFPLQLTSSFSSSQTSCPSLFLPSFLPLFSPPPPPRLRTRNDHSSCRPISLNSRGVFTKEFRGKGEKGKEKKEEKERDLRVLSSARRLPGDGT